MDSSVRDALTSFLRDHRGVKEWLLRSGASIGADVSSSSEILPTIGRITRGSYPDKLSTQESEAMYKDSPFQTYDLNGRGIAKGKRLQHLFELTLDLVREIVGSEGLIGGDSDLTACEQHLVNASFHAKRSMAAKYENQSHGDNAAGMAGAPASDYFHANKSAETEQPGFDRCVSALRGARLTKTQADQLGRLIDSARM
jgi:hypothetical protein